MASDDFTDTNGTALATHDSNWASVGETGSTDIYLVSRLEIQSNKCQQNNDFSKAGARYSTSTEDFCEAVFVSGSYANRAKYIAIQASSTRRGYILRLTGLSGDNFLSVEIYEDDGTSLTFRATASGSFDRTTNLTGKITYSSGSVRGFIGGTEEVTYADASPLTGGNPAIIVANIIATLSNSEFDDWTDGAAAGGATGKSNPLQGPLGGPLAGGL